jgi:hypothetical protein
MGYTRARRYAKYKGGKKYDAGDVYVLLKRGTGEDEKAKAAQVFYSKWKEVEANFGYAALRSDWNKEKS